MSDQGVKKSRKRIPVSCQECRKKKMKCDKQKPCSSCIKNDCAESCTYLKDSINPIVKKPLQGKSNLKKELLKLKMKMNLMEKALKANNIDFSNLVDDESLYDKYANQSEDECISTLLNKFDTMVIKENNVFRSGLVTCVALLQKDTQINSLIGPFTKQEEDEFSSYLTKQQKKASDYLIGTSSSEMLKENGRLVKHASIVPDDTLETSDFIKVLNEINKILPNVHIFNLLIERFFKYVYHFLPFVNKDVFQEEISRVLIILPNGDINFGVTHLQNASIISLILLILRFSYLTIQDQSQLDSLSNSEKYPKLSKNLIESIEGQESVETKVNLRVIQVYLYLECYGMYASQPRKPHHVSLIMKTYKLMAMARVYGIFRDPSYFDNTLHTDKRQFDVIRRIAFKLFLLDWQASFDSGTHLILFDNEIDVKIPQLSKKEKEILSSHKRGEPTGHSKTEIDRLIVENSINSDTMLEYEATILIRKCFSIVQMNSKTASKKQLNNAIIELERFTEDKIPHIYDLIQWKTEEYSHIRILELRTWILRFLITSNYLLVMNEELNGSKNTELLDASIVKTTEYSLQYFKFVFDYSYFCKSKKDSYSVNASNSNLVNTLESFSKNMDSFILTFTNKGFIHVMCWIGSVFYRSAKAKILNLDSLVEKFENNTDSTNVLQWLLCYQRWNSARTLNDQFPFILFTYLKQFYITLSSLKDDYSDCLWSWFIIKVFVKSAKVYETETYELFMENEFNEMVNEKDENADSIPCSLPDFLGVNSIKMNDSEKEISKKIEFDFLDQTPLDINNFYQQIMEDVDLNGIDLSEIPFLKDIPSTNLPTFEGQIASIQSSSGLSSTSFSPLDNSGFFNASGFTP